MKEKGIDELLYAARTIHKDYPQILFKLAGYYEEAYREAIERGEKDRVLELVGYQKNIIPFYKEASAVIMPSYHEGMSNVILEASANGRPVLATLIPGCKEGFENGVTGLGFPPRDKEALLAALRKFIELPYEQRVQMGENARLKMEKEFDRRHVVKAYMEEIYEIEKENDLR